MTDTSARRPEPLDPAAVLRWYVAMGVDLAIGEAPLDRTALPPPAPTPAPQPASQQRRAFAPPPPAPVAPAAMPADFAAAADLDDLRARLEAFEGCALRKMATRTVFGDGPADARLMVIGEAPGADEDRSGVPFVGRAGKLLDKMLASAGWPRGAVFITNVVPWRPPGNRNPTPEEVTLCKPFVLRAIELIAPEALLLLGGSAAGAILDRHDGITRLRGRWQSLATAAGEIPVMPTFHPAFLLRSPASKALAWRDLLALKARIGTAE
jgi:DNA polymerase